MQDKVKKLAARIIILYTYLYKKVKSLFTYILINRVQQVRVCCVKIITKFFLV